MIIPAVSGTTSILHSVMKCGTCVKCVVVTSSAIAVAYPPSKPTVYTENDWNHAVVAKVDILGRNALGKDKYAASKTLAEKGYCLAF
jgi:nucleoside-diphosphate-sugar epimerase